MTEKSRIVPEALILVPVGAEGPSETLYMVQQAISDTLMGNVDVSLRRNDMGTIVQVSSTRRNEMRQVLFMLEYLCGKMIRDLDALPHTPGDMPYVD